jgi:hypothetical protein
MRDNTRSAIGASDDLGTAEEAAELAALLPVFWSVIWRCFASWT